MGAGEVRYKCGSMDYDGGLFQQHPACEASVLRKRVDELEAALDLVVPTCEHLHHEKKYRHLSHEPCPVREIVMKAKGLK